MEFLSAIRVPYWLDNPLGTYSLYFAAHKGHYMRLAYADRLEGPWCLDAPGPLQREQSSFLTAPPAGPPELQPRLAAMAQQRAGMVGVESPVKNATAVPIASPDAHVIDAHREMRLSFHGLEGCASQVSRGATSHDGIHFQAAPEILGPSSLRLFPSQEWYSGMAMPGIVFRAQDGLSRFALGPTLFTPTMRHAGLLVRGERLSVCWSQGGDIPERILLSTIELRPDWRAWHAAAPTEVLRPAPPWEGSHAPRAASMRGAIKMPVNQLRAPAVLAADGRVFLRYSGAGESGIAIAEVFLDP